MPKALQQAPPLMLGTYAVQANETDRFTNLPEGATKLAFGFFGEIGSLLAALKKVHRDQLRETETDVAGEEIGDALWYLFALAQSWQVELQAMGLACLTCLRSRFGEAQRVAEGPISFRQIDGLIAVHGNKLNGCRVELLGELARMSGQVIGSADKVPTVPAVLAQTDLLGQLLAMLGLVCSAFSLKLEDVAHDNIAKTHGRWPGASPGYIALFDERFPDHEQLPRNLDIEFIERKTPRGIHVVQRWKGVHIGDPLTDNSNEPDDYRFHDVFHLAYVAHLGWSPVIRALLKLKRKSDPAVDENEDGARAMIIEEGIATWIFNHAKKRQFYADVTEGKLDYGLLKQVHSMVSGYEVAACPLWQWERAILEGFQVFRELQKPGHRGGTVVVDMHKHSLTFVPSSGMAP